VLPWCCGRGAPGPRARPSRRAGHRPRRTTPRWRQVALELRRRVVATWRHVRGRRRPASTWPAAWWCGPLRLYASPSRSSAMVPRCRAQGRSGGAEALSDDLALLNHSPPPVATSSCPVLRSRQHCRSPPLVRPERRRYEGANSNAWPKGSWPTPRRVSCCGQAPGRASGPATCSA